MTELLTRITHRGIAHEPATPTLEANGVSVAYASGTNNTTTLRTAEFALDNVSFVINAGERIAVVGPNGAGKSTLFKLIVGTLKPGRGSVTIYGHDPHGHICIAYVPQRNQIDWSFPVTVEDVVMMGRVGRMGFLRWPRRQDWDVVHASLDRVGAIPLAKKQIGDLSGGQQQRVFIARALAQEAELLLMDEPLTGLDTPSQEAIFTLLDGLRPDGVTILIATHDLNLAAERFDRVMLLNRRLVALGPATAVLTPDNLLLAYGGHMHRLQDGDLLLTDTCCDHDDPT